MGYLSVMVFAPTFYKLSRVLEEAVLLLVLEEAVVLLVLEEAVLLLVLFYY